MIKLPDFINNAELNAIRDLMGAYKLGDLVLTKSDSALTLVELDALVNGGLDVSNLDNVLAHSDGTLVYKGRRVVLYIRDVAVHGRRSGRRNDLPRFHVANCRTLDQMRAENRFLRYVVAARTTGLFSINRLSDGGPPVTSEEELDVCQNCLDRLKFDNFAYGLAASHREAIVNSFSLSRFFERYPHDVISASNAGDELTARLNEYSGDFGLHAAAAKIRAAFKCEECGLSLDSPQLKRYLHAHHVNAIKYDNSPGNLRALCIACHANQPGHGHMRTLPEFQQFLGLQR